MTVDRISERVWRDVALSQRISKSVPDACRFSVNVNWVTAIVAFAVGGFLLEPIFAWLGLAVVWFIKLLSRAIPKADQVPLNRHSYDVIDDKLDEKSQHMLSKLCKNVGVNRNTLRVVTNLTSNEQFPSIRSKGFEEFDLVIPPNFFTIWQTQPSTAYAIISHELGHVVQRDVDLRYTVRRYIRFLMSRVIALEAFVLAITFLMILHYIPQAAVELEASNFRFLTMGTSWSSVEEAQLLAMGTQIVAFAAAGVTAISLLVFTYLVIGNIIWAIRSEIVCDRIAVKLVGKEKVIETVEKFIVPGLPLRASWLFAIRAYSLRKLSTRFKINRMWLAGRIFIFSFSAMIGSFLLEFPSDMNYWSLSSKSNDFWPLGRYEAASISTDGKLLAKYDPWEETIVVLDTANGSEISSATVELSPSIDDLSFAFDSSGSILFVWSEWGVQAILVRDGRNVGELDLRSASSEIGLRSIERVDVSTLNDYSLLAVAFGSGEVALYSFDPTSVELGLKKIHSAFYNGRVVDLELLPVKLSYAIVVDIDERPDDRIAEIHVVENGVSIFSEQIPGGRGVSNIGVNSDLSWAIFSSMERVGTINLKTREIGYLSFHGLNAIINIPPPIEFLPDGGSFVSKSDFKKPFSSTAGLYSLEATGDSTKEWRKVRDLDVSIPNNTSWVHEGAKFLTRDENKYILSSIDGIRRELPINSNTDIELLASSPSGSKLATYHADGVLRVWEADPDSEISRRLLLKERLGSAECIIFVDEEAIRIVSSHEPNVTILNVATKHQFKEDNGFCEPEQQSRFSFRERTLIDKTRELDIDINQGLENDIVIVRETGFSEGHADYMIHHANTDRIGVWRIVVTRAQHTWSLKTYWLNCFVLYLIAELFLFFRRRISPRVR